MSYGVQMIIMEIYGYSIVILFQESVYTFTEHKLEFNLFTVLLTSAGH